MRAHSKSAPEEKAIKKKVRKAAFCVTVIFTLALSLQSALQAQADDNDGCTLSTLKGDYGLRISGQIFNSAGAGTSGAVI